MRFVSRTLIIASLIGMTACTNEPVSHACPDWSDNPIYNHANKDFSNFGCAYYTNLNAQLVDPADYENGHGSLSDPTADRTSAVIKPYMTDTVPNLPTTSATSAASPGGSR